MFSPQFHVQGHHIGSLKSAVMGIFRPRKSAKSKTRTFAPQRAGCSAPSPAHHSRDMTLCVPENLL